MMMKKYLFCLMVIVCIFWVPMEIMADDSPQVPVLEEAQTMGDEDERYTPGEFDGLADDDKRDIYFNSPELLPDDFDPAKYWDVMHEAEES